MKDESYLLLSVGAFVMVTGFLRPALGVFIELYIADLSQITGSRRRLPAAR